MLELCHLHCIHLFSSQLFLWQVACECENECTIRVSEDPKELQLSDLDLDGKEWDQAFFQNNTGSEYSLAGLIQLGTEDNKAKT